jgi:hypothetical protein
MKKVILTFGLVAVAQLGFSQAPAAKTATAAPVSTAPVSAAITAPVDEAFKKDVIKVIQKNGSAGQLNSAKNQILGMIPEDKHAAFLVEFEALMPRVYDGMAKVYMEVYTKADIKAMLTFYDSPVGKKMTEKASEISEKSMASAQELNGEIQAMVMKYMGQ